MKLIVKDKMRMVGKYEIRYMLFEIIEGGRKYYSFCIEQHSEYGDESREANDVCDTICEAEELYDRIYEGCVMPISLPEIAEDYIYEKTCVK